MPINRMSLIGSVLMLVLSGTAAKADTPQDREAAKLMAELIEKGYVRVEPGSGRITMKRSIYEILKDYQVIEPMFPQFSDLDPISKSTSKCNFRDENGTAAKLIKTTGMEIKTTGRCEDR